jgi:exodeoxyribonuclease VII large subunit
VQGAEAVPALRERLRAAIACGRYDVLLLTRGGGSLEDLWAFNDEQLARDIAASPIPVVAAIGHEVDTTLAELAADLRAPTPSAAAEAIAPDGAAIARQLGVHGRRLRGDTRRALQRLGQRLDIARLRLGRGDPRLRLAAVRERSGQALRRLRQGLLGLLERRRSRLAAARAALATRSPVARIAALRERLGHQQHRLCRGEQQGRRELRQRLAGLAAALQALSPLRTLDRGYAIVRDADSGRAIDRAAAVAGRALVRVELADGQVEVRPVADSLRLRDAD